MSFCQEYSNFIFSNSQLFSLFLIYNLINLKFFSSHSIFNLDALRYND
eukprot:UN13844